MFEERLKLYVELTAAAGTIAANKNDADIARALGPNLQPFG